MRALLLLLLLAAFGCRPAPGNTFTLYVSPARAALAEEALRFVPHEGLRLEVAAAPETALRGGSGPRAAWLESDACAECFQLDRDGDQVAVRGGGALGLQYGLYAVLEELGFRFHHPWRAHAPAALALPAQSEAFGRLHAPQVQRRGLHLHTLHPVEALYDFWVPSEEGREGALRTIDFLVKNRGNYLMWFALDDIWKDPERAKAWRAHTRPILDAAHARGVQVGLKIQLFGHSNLQNAFDLIDGDPAQASAAEVRARFALLLEGLPFDTINLTFGEFFGTDPELFLRHVEGAHAALQAVAPGTELTTMIHVGNQADLQVEYRGERLQQYFLVKYADPRITPWVHSVMYFNLFEPTWGAYLHREFDAHRDFLLQRVRQGQRSGYFPEAAYWIAFDNSVPLYLPLYIRSRHLDLARLADAAHLAGTRGLDEHVLFSTGWEWGYWQTDVAVLRMTWELPERWAAPVEWAWAPWGERGAALAAQLERLGEAQHEALIERGLAPYPAGRDAILDFGRSMEIVSQPDRPELTEVAAHAPPARADFSARVLAPLETFAERCEAVEAGVAALGLDRADPFLAEALDAVEVTALRARWSHTLFAAASAHGRGEDVRPALEALDGLLARAKGVVARRRDGLHDPGVKQLLRNNENPTVYQYGYLREADTLCFWQRERAQLRNLVLQESAPVPNCVL